MPSHPSLNVPAPAPPGDSPASLAEFYKSESAKIRRRFETSGAGGAALRERSDLVDALVAQLYAGLLSPQLHAPEHFSLVALGGYGRRELFPHSDVDLLFLTENGRTEAAHREAIAAILRALWDLRLRVGHSTRTLAECGRLYRDNLEFNVSLLDCRYLAGGLQLFARLHDEVIPHLVARDHRDLLANLAEMTRRRHAKHGNTIFHLEPNLKEAPGGLRDYHVCRWLARIADLGKQGRWTEPETLWPAALREEAGQAFEFLAAIRCFLHYLYERDDNQLSYENQDLAAAQGVGEPSEDGQSAADWMRDYFRHARAIHRLTARLLDEVLPARSVLYELFQDWRSRLSNADFLVVRGRVFARQPAALEQDPGLVLGLFEMLARHGLELSCEAERSVEAALPRLVDQALRVAELWQVFRRILTLPYAARALREMHRLGLLTALFPEFRAIDALVMRDFYHRYTVDEHSFMTLQSLDDLRVPRPRPETLAEGDSGTEWQRKFAEILSELEQPETLYFALLFHDVGKGMPDPHHIRGSLEAVESIFSRLELAPEDRETVRFLITNHLEMSAVFQRRDIFAPETVHAFAGKVGTPERLKMLCLLTYADIKAVSPEALTPWKAELLWQLYAATSNYLARSLDEERVRTAGPETAQAERLLPLLHVPASAEEVRSFLAGFPRRYVATHAPEEIAAHFEMARRLRQVPVQAKLGRRHHLHELTVVTADRPRLFASITGTLAAWGMNIIKADAFANAAGIVLDTFQFVDLHRTLELNPSEGERLQANLVDVLAGKLPLEQLLRGRISLGASAKAKIKVPTEIRFDQGSSSHSTLLELVAQDRPGSLYQVSSALAELGCNIEVALIDTEGQKAIDVFYLTVQGAKLPAQMQATVRKVLLQNLTATPAHDSA